MWDFLKRFMGYPTHQAPVAPYKVEVAVPQEPVVAPVEVAPVVETAVEVAPVETAVVKPKAKPRAKAAPNAVRAKPVKK